MTNHKTTLADSIPDDDCYTIEDLSKEFNLKPQRMRQVLEKAFKDRVVPRLVKTKGRLHLYAPQMVEQLKDARDKGRLGQFRNRKTVTSSLKNAQLVITVPIFDADVAKLLLKKYTDQEGIMKYVKSHLEESVKPILQKKKEIEERYEREIRQLLQSPEAAL